MFNEIEDKEIDDLLTPKNEPIMWYDKEERCVERRCSSPTYVRIQGVPRCLIHALGKCNEIIMELENAK